MKEGIALYVHIPFCAQKCTYCDFCSYPGQISHATPYFQALGRELQRHSALQGAPYLESVYIGGGTPTILTRTQLEMLFHAINREFCVDAHTEFTIEANPGTVTEEKLTACVQGGVNRLSLGMQAAQETLLFTLGRQHNVHDVAQAVRLARAAGIENISLDLMYGLPGQTMAQWEESLGAALDLGIQHLSCYELTLEGNTPLAQRVQAGALSLPDEDTCLAMAKKAREAAQRAGLARYEISNYAVAGYESRHNEAYWLCKPYIGAGCAAHGYLDGVRYANTTVLKDYMAGLDVPQTQETIGSAEAMFERLMLGLRRIHGVDMQRFFADFGISVQAAFGERLTRLIQLGMLEKAGDYLRCTPRGLDVHSAIMVALMDGEDGH